MGSPIFYAFTVVEKTNSPSAAVREPIVFAFDAEFRSGHFNRCACPLFSFFVFFVYRDILEAAQAGEKKTLQNLVERAKKLKLLKLTKVAGGVSLVLSAGSAYAGFQKDGTAGAVEAIGKDVSMQEEIGWVIMLPNNMVYRDWLKIDPDKPFDVLVDECLDKRLNGAGVSPVK
jgi:hypothetical protein